MTENSSSSSVSFNKIERGSNSAQNTPLVYPSDRMAAFMVLSVSLRARHLPQLDIAPLHDDADNNGVVQPLNLHTLLSYSGRRCILN